MMIRHSHIIRRARRGMAMMLVMIALIVGSLLTTGYLLSQNTAIGLTQNQGSSDAARQLAATGVDCALYYMKNREGWDASNYNLNWRLICDQSTSNRVLIDNDVFTGAHIRVEIKPVAPATTFSADGRTAVDIVSTGTQNGQSVTLTSRVQPTGGGTPWAYGICAFGGLNIIGPSATIDAYKSGQYGPTSYNSLINQLYYRYAASVASMQSITVDGNSQQWYTSVAYANADNISTRNGGSCSPRPAVELPMKRIPGWVVPPYATTTTTLPTLSLSTKNITIVDSIYPGTFRLEATGAVDDGDPGNATGRPLVAAGSGTVCINGDLKLDAGTSLHIAKVSPTIPSHVVFYVTGNINLQGRIAIDADCTFTIYATGEVIIERYARLNTDGMTASNKVLWRSAKVGPKAFQILGLPSCAKVRLEDHAWMAGCIFAPQSLVQLTCDSSCSDDEAVTLFGALVGRDVEIRGASNVHQDLDAMNASFSAITGGTFAGDYEVRQSW